MIVIIAVFNEVFCYLKISLDGWAVLILGHSATRRVIACISISRANNVNSNSTVNSISSKRTNSSTVFNSGRNESISNTKYSSIRLLRITKNNRKSVHTFSLSNSASTSFCFTTSTSGRTTDFNFSVCRINSTYMCRNKGFVFSKLSVDTSDISFKSSHFSSESSSFNSFFGFSSSTILNMSFNAKSFIDSSSVSIFTCTYSSSSIDYFIAKVNSGSSVTFNTTFLGFRIRSVTRESTDSFSCLFANKDFSNKRFSNSDNGSGNGSGYSRHNFVLYCCSV